VRWDDWARRALRVGFVLLAVAGLAATGWSVLRGGDLKTLGNVVGIVGSLVGTLGTLSTRVKQVRVDAEILARTANNLAGVVLTQQRKRREQLLGADFQTINVIFRHAAEPGRNAAHAGARGSLRDIAAYYERLEPRRLVIVGTPGSGKTVLATELMIQLLNARGDRDRTPFLVSLSTWDLSTRFADWLAEEIAVTHNLPLPLAAALIEHDRIVPVLDGLDEMDPLGGPPLAAEAALKQLNRYHGPLVLTCRTDEYAVLRGRRQWLWDCARVEIDEVTAAQAHDYLLSRAPDPAQWREVLHDIRRARSGVLATTLTTPWLLTLASTAALADGSPQTLSRFVGETAQPEGPNELEQELLTQCVPSLTALHPLANHRGYAGGDVLAWCVRLARFLRDTAGRNVAGHLMSGTDIVLHQMWPIAGLRKPRMVTAALTLALWTPFLGTTAVIFAKRGYFPFPGGWALVIVCALPAIATWGALGYWLQPRKIVFRRVLTANGARRFGLGLLIGLVLGLSGAVAFATPFGLLFGAAFALVFGLGLPMSVRWDIHLEGAMISGLLSALAFGAGAGLLGSRYGAYAGLVAGLAAGSASLFVSVKVGIALARRRGGGLPDEQPGTPTPRAALRDDLLAGNVAGLITGGLAFVVAWRAPWMAASLPLAMLLGVSAFLAAGPGFVAETSRRYLALLLTTRRHLPWRLGRFLDWAYGAGILRVAGTAYQFRHSRLQQWLAHAPDEPTPRPDGALRPV
jgi:hypothetical protein